MTVLAKIQTALVTTRKLVLTFCVGTHVVRTRADVVATKLFFLFLSFHILFSQKGFTYDFEFLHALLREGVKTNINYLVRIFHGRGAPLFLVT